MRKAYLGDGLYAEFDGWQIELFTMEPTEHDVNARSNQVFLGPAELHNFQIWLESLSKPLPAGDGEGDL